MQYDIRAQERIQESSEGFLMWLLWRQREGLTHYESGEEQWELVFTNKLVLGNEDGDTVTVEAEDASDAEETLRALQVGKIVLSGSFLLTRENQDAEMQWGMSMDSRAQLSAVTAPAVMSDEEDDQAMELIYLLDLAEKAVSAVFSSYLTEKQGDASLDSRVSNGLRS
jgi:hypothetical protein